MAGLLNRRTLLGTGALAGFGTLATPVTAAPKRRGKNEPFMYSLNTITISGQKLPLAEVIDLAAKTGYDAVEPWIRELDAHVAGGGSLKDLRKRIADHGLAVPSAIGFASWIVDDDAQRAKGLEEAKRSMDLVQQIGGTRIAAPPVGATDRSDLDPMRIAERYRALLELGDQMGVVPELEVWGFSKTLNRLGTAALVAVESQHPKACVLSDVYHLYKGGSDFNGMKLLSSAALPVFHVNDYPAEPRDRITDAHRVYPGDGVAPLTPLYQDLYRAGFRGYLSLELFNREYWKQDATLVAKTGLEKTRASVRTAMKDL